MPYLVLILSLCFAAFGSTPLPSAKYAFAPASAASDRGALIDLDKENLSALKAYFKLRPYKTDLLIVPGYMDKSSTKARALDPLAIQRLQMALKHYKKRPHISFLVLSGGNVWPVDTIYNEALEMKRYLITKHQVKEDRILVEPFARNSVTNLRNVGRLLMAMDVKEAKIITTSDQRFYFGRPYLSTMAFRSWQMLGGLPGKTEYYPDDALLFQPYQRVFKLGPDPLDP